MGLSVAYFLADRGSKKVTVIERGFPGQGSSGKSGAILRQHYSHPTTIAMARSSLHYFREFEERFGYDIGYVNPGLLIVGSAEDRASLETNIKIQVEQGVRASLLEAKELRELQPRAQFSEGEVGAWEPEASYVHPTKTIQSWVQLARRRGVEIVTEEPVTQLLERDGHIYGVQSAKREIHAAQVVLATGPWSRSLLRRAGVDLPLIPVRPEQAYFGAEGDRERATIVCDLTTGLYWKPEPAGWTRAGNMSFDQDPEVDPDSYDEGVSHEFLNRCRERLGSRYPEFKRGVSWGGCGALYTVTPDAYPLIGPIPGWEGLTLVSGFSGHGFKLAPSIGAGIAHQFFGGDSLSFEPSLFGVDRFSTSGQSVSTRHRYQILG